MENQGTLSLEMAKKVIQAAKNEAMSNSWEMVFFVVDSAGHLVAMERMDNAMLGAIEVAHAKARTSALFKRPTKAYEDGMGSEFPGSRLLAVKDILPFEGGVPIIKDGVINGAIGVSGSKPSNDGLAAQAGASVIE